METNKIGQWWTEEILEQDEVRQRGMGDHKGTVVRSLGELWEGVEVWGQRERPTSPFPKLALAALENTERRAAVYTWSKGEDSSVGQDHGRGEKSGWLWTYFGGKTYRACKGCGKGKEYGKG